MGLSAPVPDVSPDRARRLAARLAEACGVSADRAGFARVDEATLLARQNGLETAGAPGADPLAPVRSLVEDGLRIGPVVDGELLPTRVLDALRAGVGANKPLVLGATDDEFSLALAGAREQLDALAPPAVLGALGLGGPNPPRDLAEAVHGDATRFVAEGHPGWERWTPADGSTRVYDTPPRLERDGYADVRPLVDSSA